MTNCNASNVPIYKEAENNSVKNIKFPYREAVGSLLYLSTKTRLDLTYSVNNESRSVENPTVKRTLRYLKGSVNDGLFYKVLPDNKNMCLEVYSDSDYAGTKERKKYFWVCCLFQRCTYYVVVQESVVALSSIEAEYIAASSCCQEIKYLKSLIEEITLQKLDITLHMDNQGAIKMIRSGQMSKRTKHIDVKIRFIHNAFVEKLFSIHHCPPNELVADIMIKPLLPVKFEKFKHMLMYSQK